MDGSVLLPNGNSFRFWTSCLLLAGDSARFFVLHHTAKLAERRVIADVREPTTIPDAAEASPRCSRGHARAIAGLVPTACIATDNSAATGPVDGVGFSASSFTNEQRPQSSSGCFIRAKGISHDPSRLGEGPRPAS